ncbi:pyrroloquinoline quinone biosynthesis protein PqqB [Vibrio mimicus]
MQVIILGSGAGGGFPQWNCQCSQCAAMRCGDFPSTPRTQSSIAVSDDGKRWVIINASPDIRQQINQTPAFYTPVENTPAENTPVDKSDPTLFSALSTLRQTRIRAVILTDAQIDHTTGLLTLREGLPLPLYCTEAVKMSLTEEFPLLPIFEHWNGGYQCHTISNEWRIDAIPTLRFIPIPIRSNAPPYSRFRHQPRPMETIALHIIDEKTGGQLLYAPGMEAANSEIERVMHKVDCALIDGTLWDDDEMIHLGLGTLRGRDMGHLHLNGHDGTMAWLKPFTKPRKILVHINNTNPILNQHSAERALLEHAGIEVGFDGMTLNL